MAGLATLPNQRHAEALETGFDLTIMVIGESGLGKSTLLNALFNSDLFLEADYEAPGRRAVSTTSVQRSTAFLHEKGVRLRLTIIDTPGYGTALDNTTCCQPILAEIHKSFEQYMDEEARIHRENIMDNRIHACLYLIAPTGHGLKPLDISTLKQLHTKVNIIPILSKADAYTVSELAAMKARVLEQLKTNDIRIFNPNFEDEDEASEYSLPFAVSCSIEAIKSGGKTVRGRAYPWGAVETDNSAHSEFVKLRNFLLRVQTQDLIDQTAQVHYENYRSSRLGDITPGAKETEESILTRIEQEKELLLKKLAKTEAEMSHIFAIKVKEKEDRLRQSEVSLAEQHDNMKQDIEQLRRQLEIARQSLAREREASAASMRDRANTGSKSQKFTARV